MKYFLISKFKLLLTIYLLLLFSSLFGHIRKDRGVNNNLRDADTVSILEMQPRKLFNVPAKYSTASVSTISSQTIDELHSSNVLTTLVGKLPGLNVTQLSGNPMLPITMASSAKINIRGKGTYGMKGNNTLKVYVDGFEVDMSYLLGLPTNNIETVSIFKDAASLVNFGLEGSEGLLWVTTKRGELGKNKVNVSLGSGVQNPINIYKPLDAINYSRLYNIAVSNDNGRVWNPKYTDSHFELYEQGGLPNVDWYDEVLKSNSFYTNGNVSFSGGNEAAKYQIVFDYSNHQGLYNVANTDSTSNEMLKRYSILANLDLKFLKIFEGNLDFTGNISDFKGPNYSSSSLWTNMGRYPSNIYPIYDGDNQWSGTSIFPDNPVASIKALGWTSQHFKDLKLNF